MADTLEASSVVTRKEGNATTTAPLRVLAVIPISRARASVIFIKRQIGSLEEAGVACRSFLLASRTSPVILISEWRRLRREIRFFQPDFVHAHYGTMTAFLTVFSTTLPVIITFRGGDLNRYKSRFTLRQRAGHVLSQLAALRAAQIICVSNQLKGRLWWRRDRVSVIPTGVDTKIFFPRPRSEARRELGWQPDEPVVLFNAGVDPVSKRLDLALSSMKAAKVIYGDIRLFILDGDVPPELIPVIMNAADCLLLTSDWEGSPNVVKEAIACNLPVVTVDVGDVRERLSGVEPSRVVARRPSEIGRSIAEILRHKQRSNGATLIGELSREAVARRLLLTYSVAFRERHK